MKRIKVAEAAGKALDWMVARADPSIPFDADGPVCWNVDGYGHATRAAWRPSTDWSQGGPIIEREKISIRRWTNVPIVHAYMPSDDAEWVSGPTALTAAMRCFVASKLGNEVDVPEELST